MFKIISEPEKHILEQVLSSMIMNSYLSHQLLSTQKCLSLALALVDFTIFRIFVMIMLLNTTSLLAATKLSVYFCLKKYK